MMYHQGILTAWSGWEDEVRMIGIWGLEKMIGIWGLESYGENENETVGENEENETIVMEKMKPLLCLESDEVRMIGIWGPSGIGKTTIARFLFSKHSHSFDLSVFMENIKAFMYTRPACSDDYSLKLQLHEKFLSRIINQKDVKVPHLGVVEDRLRDKKVLVILDDVDRSVQLDAMAKETRWFGGGSRIIITTQDRRLLKAHRIEDIYEVSLPATDEALQIFCMNAFGQNSPKDGFEELAWEATRLAGELPLGLRVMGSYFRGMSKQEWTNALPRLKSSLDGEIQSILMFSYKALGEEEKDLFLLIACFFKGEYVFRLEECLAKNLWDGIQILAEKSLIFREYHQIKKLLVMSLGKSPFVSLGNVSFWLMLKISVKYSLMIQVVEVL